MKAIQDYVKVHAAAGTIRPSNSNWGSNCVKKKSGEDRVCNDYRWIMLLEEYSCKIEITKGILHGNADGMSRGCHAVDVYATSYCVINIGLVTYLSRLKE